MHHGALLRAALALAAAHTAAARASPVRAERPTARDPALRDYGNTRIWPLPASAVDAGCSATLDPADFAILVAQPAGDPYLAEIAARFLPVVLFNPAGTPWPSRPVLRNVTLTVLDPAVRQVQQGTDESYNLTFSRDCTSAAVTAPTIFGARGALESFAQLIDCGRPALQYGVQGLNVVEGPRFPFRGPLLDVSRHWHPVNGLLGFMDGLAIHKQNVLILGIGIDEVFVVESAAFPNLTVGYGPPGTHVYSREAVKFLVAEANLRGIRLLPYIELVGHDPLNLPELQYCNGVKGGGLFHPLHAEVWEFFDAFWADLRELFAEDYVQLGGDKADISCWKNDPEIEAWNTAAGRPADDLTFIYSHYMTQLMASMAKVGFLPLWYADVFATLNATGTDFAATQTMFNGWSEDTPGSLAGPLRAGAKVIVTSYCFLMPGETCPGFNTNGLAGQQPNWDYNYRCEIQNASLFPADVLPYLGNVVGGGPARWGETTDPTNLWQFTYPAQMGASEKLWSPAALTNGSLYGTRQEVFADHRCYLLLRGIPVQPTSAYSWSCDYEWEPPMPPVTPKNPNPGPHSSWAAPAARRGAGLPALPSADAERELRWARQRAAAPPVAAAAGVAEDLMSLWPYPAGAVSVPCGGAPEPAWRQLCTDCAAVSDDCAVISHGDGSGLEGCQASCLGASGCTEVNWSPATNDCVLRACPPAPVTTPYPGYNAYAAPSVSAPVGINPATFRIVLDAAVAGDAYLQEVARRALDRILWHPAGTFDRPTELASLTIAVADPSVRQIAEGVDESYTLSFSPQCTAARIQAATIFGARHGLETFSQLVQAERISGSYSLGAYFGLFNFTDAPRFGTRGLMVDSARHWLPPNVLLSLMDALSYVKMNKLEVGFGIDWSYTLQSDAFPNLTDSSYGPKGTHLYSRATVQWLVAEANLRGIRLVPFVEVVGHNALCGATPDVCWCGGKPKGNLPHPLHNITWQFFDAFWGDLKELFPETYVNVGGDEVDASCYSGDPEIMVRCLRRPLQLPPRSSLHAHARASPPPYTQHLRPGTLKGATRQTTPHSSWATTTSSRRCS
jgi:N-acetyl-beta-hexosaminidase